MLTIPSGHGDLLFGAAQRLEGVDQRHGCRDEINITEFLQQPEYKRGQLRGEFHIILSSSSTVMYTHMQGNRFPPKEKTDGPHRVSSRIRSNDLAEGEKKKEEIDFVLML